MGIVHQTILNFRNCANEKKHKNKMLLDRCGLDFEVVSLVTLVLQLSQFLSISIFYDM